MTSGNTGERAREREFCERRRGRRVTGLDCESQSVAMIRSSMESADPVLGERSGCDVLGVVGGTRGPAQEGGGGGADGMWHVIWPKICSCIYHLCLLFP